MWRKGDKTVILTTRNRLARTCCSVTLPSPNHCHIFYTNSTTNQHPQFVFGRWVFFSWIVRNAWDTTDTRTALQNKTLQKAQNIVNMLFCQQSDRFARLFFNIFNSTNRLMKLVQTLHSKVKREFPSLWARSFTRPSVSWARLVSFWLTLSLVRLRTICWAGEEPVWGGVIAIRSENNKLTGDADSLSRSSLTEAARPST